MTLFTLHRRPQRLALVTVIALVTVYFFVHAVPTRPSWQHIVFGPGSFDWAHRRERYPVPKASLVELPASPPRRLPPIQHAFSNDPVDPKLVLVQSKRREEVRGAFRKSWAAYKEYAWGFDELKPQSLRAQDTFGGWGATLVDSLDTLWIMGLKEEFAEAVSAVHNINWNNSSGPECSLFETNIRYLGGLLSAYDLSQEQILLDKALELGHMLYAAFDNKYRLPVNSFVFDDARAGRLELSWREASAAVGSLSLEFTRLAQLTNETKFYDAIDKIKRELDRIQSDTNLPGMWPTFLDLQSGLVASDIEFTLGALADSLYEYMPKMYALLGGLDDTYEKMHKYAMHTVTEQLLYRPMIADEVDILFSGTVLSKVDRLFSGTVMSNGRVADLIPENQHLACFAGGMFALGGKLFGVAEHVKTGERLARGCAWSYSAFPTGIMPEVSVMVACREPDLAPCEWNETRWVEESGLNDGRFPRGFAGIRDRRYILRPEAIESVFLLYRMTGDREWLDRAWAMFTSIKKATETKYAFSAIGDVLLNRPMNQIDSMESFWLAETLKYFYLIFSSPDVISLDEYVFNTEAHPFKLPKPT